MYHIPIIYFSFWTGNHYKDVHDLLATTSNEETVLQDMFVLYAW